MLTSIFSSALLCGLFTSGGMAWVLGFVALAPWLHSLRQSPSLRNTLLSAWLMSVCYSAAVFAWFGSAIGDYTNIGATAGVIILLLAAPLFQPQIIALALARHLTSRRYGQLLSALAGATAWLACERLLPKLLGDTLGHGLYPAPLLRQLAEHIGAAGLTLLLLLANEAFAAAWPAFRRQSRAALKPIAVGLGMPALLAAYGWVSTPDDNTQEAKPLRVGLIQSNLVHYERMRTALGAEQAVRQILDTHYAMSYDAVERQGADVVLWSETVYPTTFGQPKSRAGAGFDQEILGVVRSARVPFVFGTYDLDSNGEYNAAAFVSPQRGLIGMYRKTRLFPLTEYVPPWLDGPGLRRLLPWAGTWQPGNGARIFPLQLHDGRDIPVLPLICRDDIDTQLAIDGARLGAQAILTMSNDSWFSDYPRGAALHQAVAAFRSIETRLPQFRVTNHGFSAAIDARGNIVAGSLMGEQTLVIGALPAAPPAPTLMVQWGNWVGLACTLFLTLLAVTALLPRWQPHPAASDMAGKNVTPQSGTVAVLPLAARISAGLLRTAARCGLLWLAFAMLLDDSLRANTLAQTRLFGMLFLLPEACARLILRAFAAQARIVDGELRLQSGPHILSLPLAEIAAARLWWLPLPGPGLTLQLRSGQTWRYGLALRNPADLAQALGPLQATDAPGWCRSMLTLFTRTRESMRHSKLEHPAVKYLLFPLLLALPAFRLHQHIAYGSSFGEYYSFGLKAYLTTLCLWWATWAIGVATSAALLRMGMESMSLIATLLRPQQASDSRYLIERIGQIALYLGMPLWLVWRMTGSN